MDLWVPAHVDRHSPVCGEEFCPEEAKLGVSSALPEAAVKRGLEDSALGLGVAELGIWDFCPFDVTDLD